MSELWCTVERNAKQGGAGKWEDDDWRKKALFSCRLDNWQRGQGLSKQIEKNRQNETSDKHIAEWTKKWSNLTKQGFGPSCVCFYSLGTIWDRWKQIFYPVSNFILRKFDIFLKSIAVIVFSNVGKKTRWQNCDSLTNWWQNMFLFQIRFHGMKIKCCWIL